MAIVLVGAVLGGGAGLPKSAQAGALKAAPTGTTPDISLVPSEPDDTQGSLESLGEETPAGSWQLRHYVSRYEPLVFSNLSYFNRDPIDGDMLEQVDDQMLAGGETSYTRVSEHRGIGFTTTFTLQTRNQLSNRELTSSVDETLQSSLSATAQEEITWSPWLHTAFALRANAVHFQTNSPPQAVALNPKANITASLSSQTEVFANVGMGLDTFVAQRGTPADPDNPTRRFVAYEGGARTRVFDQLDVESSLSVLDMHTELVPAAGSASAEASGRTRRWGLKVQVQLELWSWLYADADLSLTQGRYRGASRTQALALASRLSGSAGLTALHPDGFFGRTSVFHLAERARSEPSPVAARATSELNATFGYTSDVLEFTLNLQHVMSGASLQASAAACPPGTQALSNDGGFSGCEELNFIVGPPINVQASLLVFF